MWPRSLTCWVVFGLCLSVAPGQDREAMAAADTFPTAASMRLRVPETEIDVFEVLADRFDIVGQSDLQIGQLPALDVNVASDGQILVPAVRGRRRGLHPFWDVTIEPGFVAATDSGNGSADLVFPVSLHETGEDCVFHGQLRVSYAVSGGTGTAAYEFFAETCHYLQLNMTASAANVTVDADAPFDAFTILRAYRGERAGWPETLPLSALDSRFPGFQSEKFLPDAAYGSDQLTVAGIFVDDILYLGDCPARAGRMLDCTTLNLPSYSLAKSIVAALTLFRLEQIVPGAASASISDYVPECRQAGGWQDVTFADALNMATGHFLDSQPNADESGDTMIEFFIAAAHRDKIAIACGFPRKRKAGEAFLYRSADHYVLGTAMQNYYRQHVRAAGDFFNDLIAGEIFHRLGLGPSSRSTTRTSDEIAQPYTYNGLSLQVGDIARLGKWIGTGGGRLNGEQVLSPALLNAAVQGEPNDRGLVAGRLTDARPGQHYRYKNGFWAIDVSPIVGCAQESWVPFMSGVSGNVVMIFPNGIVYFHFSDGGHFSTAHLLPEIHKIRSLCTGTRS